MLKKFNTKKLIVASTALFLALVVAFLSFDIMAFESYDDEYVGVYELPPASPFLSLSTSHWAAPSVESRVIVEITSDVHYSAAHIMTSGHYWLNAYVEHGAVIVHTQSNDTGQRREGTIFVMLAGITRVIDVVQLCSHHCPLLLGVDIGIQTLDDDGVITILPTDNRPRPIIFAPSANGMSFTSGDRTISWHSIPGATYHVSLRNLSLTPNESDGPPLINRQGVGNGTSFTIPASYLTAGNNFRVAVAADLGMGVEMYTWYTRYFSINRDAIFVPPTTPPTTTPPSGQPGQSWLEINGSNRDVIWAAPGAGGYEVFIITTNRSIWDVDVVVPDYASYWLEVGRANPMDGRWDLRVQPNNSGYVRTANVQVSVDYLVRIISVTQHSFFQDNSVIVTFDGRPGTFAGGVTYVNQVATPGEAIGRVPDRPPFRDMHFSDPRDRHNFIGWFTQRNHLEGNRFTESSIMPDDGVTLYASWTDPRRHIEYWVHSDTIYLSPDIQINPFGSEGADIWQRAINSAIQSWNESGSPVSLVFCENIAQTNQQLGRIYMNTISVSSEPNDWFGTMQPEVDYRSRIVSFYIVLSSQSIYTLAARGGDYELYNVIKSVMTHEIGHLASLRDDPRRAPGQPLLDRNESVMHTTRDRSRVIGITNFDVESMNIVYHDWR